jgi:hypothetical protein
MHCHLLRFASNTVAFFIVGVLAASMAACRGSQDFSMAGALQPRSLGPPAIPAHIEAQRYVISDLGALGGGTFKASYTGDYSLVGCVGGVHWHRGEFAISGSGKASFLRKSTEQGQMSRGIINEKICVGWGGNATLTSIHDAANSIYVDLNDRNFVQSPCGQAVSFGVISGTGKFARATGSGTVTFQCSGSGSGQYTDQWAGTITF